MNISKLSLVGGEGEGQKIIAYLFVHHLLEHCNPIQSFPHWIRHTISTAFGLHHPHLPHLLWDKSIIIQLKISVEDIRN